MLGPAIPEQEYGADLELAYPLAAALLLSQHQAQSEEEQTFWHQAIAMLMRSAVHLAKGEAPACDGEPAPANTVRRKGVSLRRATKR